MVFGEGLSSCRVGLRVGDTADLSLIVEVENTVVLVVVARRRREGLNHAIVPLLLHNVLLHHQKLVLLDLEPAVGRRVWTCSR